MTLQFIKCDSPQNLCAQVNAQLTDKRYTLVGVSSYSYFHFAWILFDEKGKP